MMNKYCFKYIQNEKKKNKNSSFDLSIALFSNASDGRDEGHYGSSVGKFLMRRPISVNHSNASVTGCIHPSMNSVPLSTFQTLGCTISPRMSFKTKTQPNVNYLATLIPREGFANENFCA